MSEIGCDEWDLWLKAAPRKETSYLLDKDKQFKTSTAAFLTEGSIEFFIVPKKRQTKTKTINHFFALVITQFRKMMKRKCSFQSGPKQHIAVCSQ